MSFFEYVVARWDHLLELTIEHIQVVVSALIIAIVIGVSLGVFIYRRERLMRIVLAVVSTFLTIPSFALFAIMIPIFGLGFRPTVAALVFYSLLPIVRNTVVGLRSVDPAVSESAKGMGMSSWQQLFRIDLPLAWPVIVAGVRVATLLIMGIAAIAAVVNGPGLGDDIFAGLARIGSAQALNLVLGGTLGIILLALVFDGILTLISKLTTSRGIQ